MKSITKSIGIACKYKLLVRCHYQRPSLTAIVRDLLDEDNISAKLATDYPNISLTVYTRQ